MKGLLLAAGLGTRFKPYTDQVPKPAIPLLNVPIAYYNLQSDGKPGATTAAPDGHECR
jgi:NDP-sugar pyrophosphorylase family protein